MTIKGKNNDGKDFIPAALKKGAVQIISSKKMKRWKKKTLSVNNEIELLNNFALKKRNSSSAQIFAITGSAGKTSLKNLIKNLLQNFGETLSSPKSYNNQFGVPLTLSQLSLQHKYAVIEVGMNKVGEINSLTKIIKPEIAIITNIGEAHIENFKNVQAIADAKGEIMNNIKKNGTIILNRDDKYFNYLKKKATLKDLKVISFGCNKKSDVHPITISRNSRKSKLVVNIIKEKLSLEIKDINIYNVLASLALLKELNLDFKKISKLFQNYEPSEGRGKIYNIKRYNKKFKLIDESYNANPLSVKNAIENFDSIKT